MAIVINSQWDAQQFYKEREYARRHINSQWDAQQFYQTYGGNGYAGNWGSREWAANKYGGNSYVYSPATRSWSKTSISSFSTSGFKSSKPSSSSGLGFSSSSSGLGFSKGSTGTVSQAGVVSPKDASTNTKTGAEKEYIETEFNILQGDITLVPTKNNMKIKAGCTIQLTGVGKYLSGLYFVSEVKKRIDKDSGFTLTATLFKNGFGESLKSSPVVQAVESDNGDRTERIDKTEQTVNYNFKVGDKVKIVGDNAIYSNAHEGKKVPNWVKNEILTIDAFSEDKNRVRLNPIWSWTYVKFLSKA